MKIGILTFHCAHNYGAVLQCYATQEFLRSKGQEVEIINYRPSYLLRPYRLFDKGYITRGGFKRLLKNIVQESIIFPTRYTRWKVFQRFINKRLSLSKPFSDLSSVPDVYDAYIVGSDQVWNPNITCGFDDVYFCNFPFQKGNKKYISYAASMESKELSDTSKLFYRTKLKNFDAISVREKNLQELLSPLSNVPIQHVLDPTLMISRDVWNRFVTTSIPTEKYVLVYGHQEHTKKFAEEIAKQLSAKVVVIGSWVTYYNMDEYNEAAPEDFVYLIRNAACVVTTSFHGTAFSIVLNRPFYTLSQGGNTRSLSLLRELGLQDRMIDTDRVPQFVGIDYNIVNQKLDVLRKESELFLVDALDL